MIKYHPSDALLEEFVSGKMVASVAVIVSSHVEMCQKCQEKVAKLTENAAMSAFGMSDPWSESEWSEGEWSQGEPSENNLFKSGNFESNHQGFDDEYLPEQQSSVIDLIQGITDTPQAQQTSMPTTVTEIDVSGTRVSLPNAIRSLSLNEWQGLGKISRARLNLDDDKRRTSLLHIDKGGHVPSHTHKGFEITLLLQGSFKDEMDTYHAGDFIWLDGKNTHTPATQDGCVCLTVSSDSLHFTQGVSQLFNPLGKLIY
ncbi:ChrR family anti-sigma-E factor [Vibrio sp. YMD68]|uniref:ChrR family anti-sigma-E factor n=1 Tax=Vibrio sp. YMD68 TaxID=3042300 RepID=UPI00249C0D16|nr:ChrR family anti-sigma-E factor [Vibrio sp. YMD68]WGV98650.1 ChrR family anti-sigma-E factor [Vibrio sp. YMD68]